jgi:hypothetical protein
MHDQYNVSPKTNSKHHWNMHWKAKGMPHGHYLLD